MIGKRRRKTKRKENQSSQENRDEVHQSVCCLLVVPHLARLPRLWGRPRPCALVCGSWKTKFGRFVAKRAETWRGWIKTDDDHRLFYKISDVFNRLMLKSSENSFSGGSSFGIFRGSG